MSLYDKFKTDSSLEKKGIELDYGPNKKLPKDAEGNHPVTIIYIARAGGANEQYLKRMEAKAKPHRRQIQHETIDRELIASIIKEVYAETVVLGWENVTDENGVVMEFSKANCLKLFNDLPDLYADISEQAQSAALFRVSVREIDAKN